MNVGVVFARGRGSSLPRKNIYPLNGVPMLAHFLTEIKQSRHLDKLFVWTEDHDVATVVQSCRAIVLERPREMVHYHAGFYTVEDWHRFVHMQVVREVGEPSIIAFLNCNYTLLTSRTVDKMFEVMYASPDVARVLAVADVSAGVVMNNQVTGFVFPLFPTLQGLVRKIGISLTRNKGMETRLFHLNWEESRDIQNSVDIPFAEFCLRRRNKDV